MKLLELKTVPKPLFNPISFNNGLNIIYGYKDENDPNSLHGIGKSLLLDLIDFALLADYKPSGNSRLVKAVTNTKLGAQTIVLKFKVDNVVYRISRSFKNFNQARFGLDSETHKEESVKNLRPLLASLIFYRKDYEGVYSDDWYSKLMKFFIKIQRSSGESFTNPVKFSYDPVLFLNQLHLFLLNINNSLLSDTLDLYKEISTYKNLLSTSLSFIKKNYDVKNISELKTKIRYLKSRIKRIDERITAKNSSAELTLLNEEANKFNNKIKQHLLLINAYQLRKKELVGKRDNISDSKIDETQIIYSQFNEMLGNNSKKTLSEVKSFRQKLFESRKDFIHAEIEELKSGIAYSKHIIEELSEKQTKIFNKLSYKKPLEDLETVYQRKTDLVSEISEKSTILKNYIDIEKHLNQLKKKKDSLGDYFTAFIDSHTFEVIALQNRINFLYSTIIAPLSSSTSFALSKAQNDDNIILNILPNQRYSHGKNQARTLIYDLAVLFNGIENNLHLPKFLIHDGIFDSIDHSHFSNLYNYCKKLEKEKVEFQYIITLNQYINKNDSKESEPNKEEPDKISHETLIKESIHKLTPKNKLLGKDF